MSTLYQTRCGSGTVTVTETNVIVDAPGGRKSETVARASITRIDTKKTIPSLLGMGGAHELVIYSNDGRHVTLRVVKPKDAQTLLAILR